MYAGLDTPFLRLTARLIRIHPADAPDPDPGPQAKELLGWEPKVSLREGLASMVEDFRHRLHLDDSVPAAKTK